MEPPSVVDWLTAIGLGQYAELFDQNGIDFSVLPELTEQDLQDLGIVVGHRRRLLRAIAELEIKASTEQTPAEAAAPVSSPAERRHLTLMFCDLVGAATLAAQLDPEDMREVVRAYHDVCAKVVARYEGHAEQFLSDGVVVYFGYPKAHEDDAERAVRAALDIVDAVQRLETTAGRPLQARVGVATGLVVVGGPIAGNAAFDRGAAGTTPNLAARLQSCAAVGEVIVSAATRRLLGDLFYYRHLPQIEVKGLAEPVDAWAIEGVSSWDSRFEAVRTSRLTPFVGRDHEAEELTRRGAMAWAGAGQVVLISGEAGIGKSRLAARFATPTPEQPFIRLRLQCSSYHTASAFYPVIEQLKRATDLHASDSTDARLDKLEALIALATLEVQRVAPLFAALLSIPYTGRYPALDISPAQQRRQTMSALLDQIEGLARRKPVLLLFEDAQWSDASTLEVLDLMTERVRHLPVLVLITCRPDFEPSWVGLPNVCRLTLSRLDSQQARVMISDVAGSKQLPDEVVAQLIAKTDGVPLFIEEMTKAVLESGLLVEDSDEYRLAGPLPPLAIPTTLHDSLMSRLDRLSPEKEVVQVGAMLGREFSYALLRAVAGKSDETLNAALAQLEDAQLLSRSGVPPEAIYSFRHALLQDAAYESLLKTRRVVLHRRIAEILCQQFPVVAEKEPEIIAHHYTEAGLTSLAVQWWWTAAEQAATNFAFVEATAHFSKALALADAAADGVVPPDQRLSLHIAYGQALIGLRGHSPLETIAAFTKARELAERFGDAQLLLPIYHSLWTARFARGELTEMRELSESFLRVTQKRGATPAEHGIAHRQLGATCFAVGDQAAAKRHLEQALAASMPGLDANLQSSYAHDPGMAARLHLAVVLWLLGEVRRAHMLAEEALAVAAASRRMPTILFGHGFKCFFDVLCRDTERALPIAETLVNVSQTYGLQSTWFGIGTLIIEWCRFRSGDRDRLTKLREAVARYQGQGFFLYFMLLRALLAEAEEATGELDAALATVDALLVDAERTGLCWLDVELHRQRGSILRRLRPGDTAGWEASYRRALTIATEQGARALELRAALDLAKAYQTAGRAGDAEGVLAPALVDWGEEGFPELNEAQRLLASLRRGGSD